MAIDRGMVPMNVRKIGGGINPNRGSTKRLIELDSLSVPGGERKRSRGTKNMVNWWLAWDYSFPGARGGKLSARLRGKLWGWGERRGVDQKRRWGSSKSAI